MKSFVIYLCAVSLGFASEVLASENSPLPSCAAAQKPTDSRSEQKKQQVAAYEMIVNLAKEDAASYLSGEDVNWNRCEYSATYLGLYTNALSSQLYTQTKDRLRETLEPDLVKFVSHLEKKFGEKAFLPGFLVIIDESFPELGKAGVSPETGLIFFKIEELTPAEWYLVFLHEMSHVLDPLLVDAARTLATSKKAVQFLASKLEIDAALSKEARQLVDALVLVGLNRGLFAEVRAWYESLCLFKKLQRRSDNTFDVELEVIDVAEFSCEKGESSVLQILRRTFVLPESSFLLQPRYRSATLESYQTSIENYTEVNGAETLLEKSNLLRDFSE